MRYCYDITPRVPELGATGHAWWLEYRANEKINHPISSDAYATYLRNLAYQDAAETGDDWGESRPPQ